MHTSEAERAAMEMSHASASPTPPPAATPLMRAMVGTDRSPRACIAGTNGSSPNSSGGAGSASVGGTWRRSAPEQKPRPSPVRIATRIDGSASTRASAALRSRITSPVSAFSVDGRSRVMVATPSVAS